MPVNQSGSRRIVDFLIQQLLLKQPKVWYSSDVGQNDTGGGSANEDIYWYGARKPEGCRKEGNTGIK